MKIFVETSAAYEKSQQNRVTLYGIHREITNNKLGGKVQIKLRKDDKV